jgi:DNA mismatch repair protein MutS
MRQYHAAKQQAPNTLLLFRLGDFYELFYEDAVTAARELEITLTSRNKEKGEPIPMAGFPHHSAESYISRLIQRGYRVALCEQMEEAGPGKKLVRREITRVITPGTATESGLLKSHENNYLAAVATGPNQQAALAHVDLSTGEFRVTELTESELTPALEGLSVKEVLAARAQPGWPGLVTELDAWILERDYAERLLKDHYSLLSLDGLSLSHRPLALGAAAAILHYLRDTQKAALSHLERPVWYERANALALDAVTIRNLELIEPLFAGEPRESTLIHILDVTKTGMGGRLLRRRLLRPSLDLEEIEQRLDDLQTLYQDTIRRAKVREILSPIADLERLLAKATLGTANPRDLLALGKSLAQIPLLNQAHSTELDEIAPLRDTLLNAISDQPPVNLADGGAIRDGFHAPLDELRDIQRNGRQYLAQVEIRERDRTGISSLKVRFNNIFGYYIEISKANLHLVPPDYERKQTLVNAERFTTPELKELEGKILAAEEKILAIEKELIQSLREQVASEATRIRAAAAGIAAIDCTAALAETAVQARWTRPRFPATGELRILQGRHPVIERFAERDAQRFIPNDIYLDSQQFIAVITGPNMGGKSTYLRQAALISILAQMGSFVPAEQADLPLADRVFTRIGAADNLARGRSTFMVEMTETALILNTATNRSLIILDEIGRGTATYDGLSLAWAILEYVHDKVGAKALFATHYHELTELAQTLPGIRNLRVSVKEAGEQIIFLRKVEPGAADRSYGIEVARLAALPAAVIERAREILALHESSEQKVSRELAPAPVKIAAPLQIRLFEPVNHGLAERIRSLNLDTLRPIDALTLLAELQKELA